MAQQSNVVLDALCLDLIETQCRAQSEKDFAKSIAAVSDYLKLHLKKRLGQSNVKSLLEHILPDPNGFPVLESFKQKFGETCKSKYSQINFEVEVKTLPSVESTLNLDSVCDAVVYVKVPINLFQKSDVKNYSFVQKVNFVLLAVVDVCRSLDNMRSDNNWQLLGFESNSNFENLLFRHCYVEAVYTNKKSQQDMKILITCVPENVNVVNRKRLSGGTNVNSQLMGASGEAVTSHETQLYNQTVLRCIFRETNHASMLKELQKLPKSLKLSIILTYIHLKRRNLTHITTMENILLLVLSLVSNEKLSVASCHNLFATFYNLSFLLNLFFSELCTKDSVKIQSSLSSEVCLLSEFSSHDVALVKHHLSGLCKTLSSLIQHPQSLYTELFLRSTNHFSHFDILVCADLFAPVLFQSMTPADRIKFNCDVSCLPQSFCQQNIQ